MGRLQIGCPPDQARALQKTSPHNTRPPLDNSIPHRREVYEGKRRLRSTNAVCSTGQKPKSQKVTSTNITEIARNHDCFLACSPRCVAAAGTGYPAGFVIRRSIPEGSWLVLSRPPEREMEWEGNQVCVLQMHGWLKLFFGGLSGFTGKHPPLTFRHTPSPFVLAASFGHLIYTMGPVPATPSTKHYAQHTGAVGATGIVSDLAIGIVLFLAVHGTVPSLRKNIITTATARLTAVVVAQQRSQHVHPL